MTTITNISEELARRILGQYSMTDDQIDYALTWALDCQTFEGKHNGHPLKITADKRSRRFSIIRA